MSMWRGMLLGAAMMLPEGAAACQFHGYTPDPTLVDRLLTTEQAVVARPDGAGRYQPVTTLLGPAVGTVPISMGPVTRMLIAAGEGDRVLLARDGAYGPWQEVAVLDSRFGAVVTQVAARQSAWQLGNEADRLRLFASLVNDSSPGVRRLALRELDRASYGALKAAGVPTVAGLQAALAGNADDLRPIRVLLAGLSGDQRFAPLLRAGLEQAVAADLPYLGAYATALIELEGTAGVQEVFGRHLARDNLSLVTRTRLLEAAAIQYRSAPPATRQVITQEVAALLKRSPELRAVAVSQF